MKEEERTDRGSERGGEMEIHASSAADRAAKTDVSVRDLNRFCWTGPDRTRLN